MAEKKSPEGHLPSSNNDNNNINIYNSSGNIASLNDDGRRLFRIQQDILWRDMPESQWKNIQRSQSRRLEEYLSEQAAPRQRRGRRGKQATEELLPWTAAAPDSLMKVRGGPRGRLYGSISSTYQANGNDVASLRRFSTSTKASNRYLFGVGRQPRSEMGGRGSLPPSRKETSWRSLCEAAITEKSSHSNIDGEAESRFLPARENNAIQLQYLKSKSAGWESPELSHLALNHGATMMEINSDLHGSKNAVDAKRASFFSHSGPDAVIFQPHLRGASPFLNPQTKFLDERGNSDAGGQKHWPLPSAASRLSPCALQMGGEPTAAGMGGTMGDTANPTAPSSPTTGEAKPPYLPPSPRAPVPKRRRLGHELMLPETVTNTVGSPSTTTATRNHSAPNDGVHKGDPSDGRTPFVDPGLTVTSPIPGSIGRMPQHGDDSLAPSDGIRSGDPPVETTLEKFADYILGALGDGSSVDLPPLGGDLVERAVRRTPQG